MRLSALSTAGAAWRRAEPVVQAAPPRPRQPKQRRCRRTATSASGYNEAPMLAELVQQGTLPPVDERLPQNPRVIPVTEEIGEYGGTWFRWRSALEMQAPSTAGFPTRISVRWSEDGGSVVPNAAESFEVNDNATEFTILCARA